MTDIGNIRSFITADSTDFDRNLDKAGQKSESFARKAVKNFKKVGDEMRTLGKGLALAVTLPLAAAGAGLLKLASDAEETQSKFNIVFSGVADQANATAKSLADSFGFAGDQALELLGDTGDLLTGFEFSQQAALDLSTQVNTLAADLASFTNFEGGSARASVALTKAILGETEQAKALGIVIRQDSDEFINLVKQQQESKGMSLLQAKAIAALTIATSQSKNAIGDFARTQHSFANQMKIAAADTRDMAVSMGQQLLPLAMLVLKWSKDIFAAFGDLNPQTQRLAIAIGVVAAAIGPLLFVGGTMISMFIGLLSAVAPVVLVLGMIGAALVALPVAVTLVVDTFRGLSNFFGEFSAFMSGEWADLSEDSKTAIEIIAKGWLSLKVAWHAVGSAMVSTVRVIAQAIGKFVGGIEWLAETFGIDLPEGVKNFSASMDDVIGTLKDVEGQNTDTMVKMMSMWDQAPELLRGDINRLADTFKALPEGIIKQLESAFPGAVAAVRELVAQVQEFINSGELPPITLPVVPGVSGGAGGGDMLGVSDMEAIGAEIEAFQEKQREATAAIRKMWMGVGGTYVSVFGQMSSLMKKNSAEQKAFAIASIILDTAIGIMKAMELPYPLNWAQAAAVGILGAAQLAAVGGAGGGNAAVSESTAAGGNFSDQTAVSGSVRNSQVIGAPETDLDATGDIPVIKLVLDGDDAAVVVTRAALRGAGDGVNTLATVGA